MPQVARTAAPPEVAPDFRREKWAIGIVLALLSLAIAAFGGLLIGSRLAQGPRTSVAWNQEQSADQADGFFGAFGMPRIFGPRIDFSPTGFPAERFQYTPPAESESATDEATADGDLIGESGTTSPVDLLGGDSQSVGESPGDIFFGQDPPPGDAPGEKDLFDLGAESNPPPSAPATESFVLSLGSFESRANADQLVKQLLGKGVSATISERDQADGTVLFKVYGGRFPSRAEAESLADTLRGLGVDAWLVKG